MSCKRLRLRPRVALAVALVAGAALPVSIGVLPAEAATSPFGNLASGFSQSVFASGTTGDLYGGIAFAPNGDVWTDDCLFSGSALRRFSQSSTFTQNGATLATETDTASNAGCGLTNNPDGFLYSNTSNGVVQINATTGVSTGVAFGSPGDALGIATDPQTNNLVYVGSDGTIFTAPPGGVASTFSSAMTGSFIDGIAFDPTGQFLFLSNRTLDAVTILHRDGTLVQNSPVISGVPDGISFHGTSPQFVVTNNNDGSMSRLDFPGNDYSQAPTLSVFASGGYRGDLSSVGSDGCIYLTQDGSNFPDGTTSLNNSIVQICPGFTPPPGVGGPCTGTSNVLANPGFESPPVGSGNAPPQPVTNGWFAVTRPSGAPGQSVSPVHCGEFAGHVTDGYWVQDAPATFDPNVPFEILVLVQRCRPSQSGISDRELARARPSQAECPDLLDLDGPDRDVL